MVSTENKNFKPKTQKATHNRPSKSGHESVLSALCASKSKILIQLVDNMRVIGQIRAFDRYTISIIPEGETYTSVIFKSAIVCFRGL